MGKRLVTYINWALAVTVMIATCGSASAHEEEALEYQWTSAVYKKEMLFQTRIMLVALVLLILMAVYSRLSKRRRMA